MVIGIIAVLVSLLLPALGKARDASNRTACLSNIRQLGIGVMLYAHENKGWFPSQMDNAAGSWKPDAIPQDAYEFIVKRVLKGHGWTVDPNLPNPPRTMWPEGHKSIWNCPSYAGPQYYLFEPATGGWVSSYASSYLYLARGPSTRVAGWEKNPDLKARARRTSDKDGWKKPLFADTVVFGATSLTYGKNADNWYINHPRNKGKSMGNGVTVGLTVAGANQMFADGHAEWKSDFPKLPNGTQLSAAAPASILNNARGAHSPGGVTWFWW